MLIARHTVSIARCCYVSVHNVECVNQKSCLEVAPVGVVQTHQQLIVEIHVRVGEKSFDRSKHLLKITCSGKVIEVFFAANGVCQSCRVGSDELDG